MDLFTPGGFMSADTIPKRSPKMNSTKARALSLTQHSRFLFPNRFHFPLASADFFSVSLTRSRLVLYTGKFGSLVCEPSSTALA